jgi:hypothetical protein
MKNETQKYVQGDGVTSRNVNEKRQGDSEMRRKQRDRQIYEKKKQKEGGDIEMARHREGKTEGKRDREMVR